MFQAKIKELNDITIELNVVYEWFRKNIDPNNDTLPEFLKLNNVFPVGEARNQAYLELMFEKIKVAGRDAEFKEATEEIIKTTRQNCDDLIDFLKQVSKYADTVTKSMASVKDKATFNSAQVDYSDQTI